MTTWEERMSQRTQARHTTPQPPPRNRDRAPPMPPMPRGPVTPNDEGCPVGRPG